MLYEFINMSDKITFNALNDDYARAATLLVGNGKAGCKKQDGTSLSYCMTAFHGEAPEEIYQQIENMLKNKDNKLVKTLNSFAVCDFNEREIYENYTENSTNKEKVQQWDDVHRTSMNQFVKYARNLAEKLWGCKVNYQDISSERLIKMYAQDCDLYRTTLHQVLDALVSHFNKDWAVDVLITNIQSTLKNTSKPPESYNFEEKTEEVPF